MLIVLV